MRKQVIAWAALWVASIAMISIKGGTVSYCFFFFFTCMPIVSYIYLAAALAQFRIYQNITGRTITVGSPIDYDFTLENAGWFSIASIRVQMFSDFSKVEDIPGEVEFELLPGESYRYSTRVACKYRGTYMIGVQKLILTDYLNLFRLVYKLPSTLEAIVVPRIPELSEMAQEDEISQWQQRENNQLHSRPDAGAKPYEAAEGMKRIHWKATAVLGELMSRTSVGEQQSEVAVYLDTYRISNAEKEYLPVENKMLETALLFSRYYLTMGQPVAVSFKSRDTGTALEELNTCHMNSLGEFDGFYEVLRDISFDMESTEDIFERFAGSRDTGAAERVLVILSGISKKMAEIVLAARENGFDITILYVGKREELPAELSEVPTVCLACEEDSL